MKIIKFYREYVPKTFEHIFDCELKFYYFIIFIIGWTALIISGYLIAKSFQFLKQNIRININDETFSEQKISEKIRSFEINGSNLSEVVFQTCCEIQSTSKIIDERSNRTLNKNSSLKSAKYNTSKTERKYLANEDSLNSDTFCTQNLSIEKVVVIETK